MDYFCIISLISPVNKYILPVISVAPEYATQSIGNVLEDRDAGEEVVVVDEGETEWFAVVGHETVAQTNRKEANPYLQLTKLEFT